MPFSVYLILNDKDPNSLYVGTSNDPHKRFIKHCSKSSRCRRLKNAIKKFGRESFRMVVVEEFSVSSDAYSREVILIEKFKSEGKTLYNLTAGGYGAKGRTVRKRTREKISASLKRNNAEDQGNGGLP